jgi:archaellum biogenesis ATPase FlaH
MRGDKLIEPPSREPEEPTLSLSVRYELDPPLAAEIKRELLSLVQERNRLIHRDLVLVDFNSIDACNQLSLRLDEQNDRINKQLQLLQTMRDAHLAVIIELAQFVASEEFTAQLGHNAEDA